MVDGQLALSVGGDWTPPPMPFGAPRALKQGKMLSVQLLLLILAFVCTLLAALGVTTRVHLGWLGLSLWLLSTMLR